ncbi:KEOPS complex subunit Pcc1 [Haloglomus litoreum]|uniref:KEOPS complex subunit Pcc1 n=1 Tax=Haloglomus litoreum TaxID=3034026 RepID=UPI0023E79364|nr:KEOPS complex subunit Pcc1 [Haloglomus sp. DT116]
MSGTDAAGDGTDGVRKRATIRTHHDDPAVVARAVRPDNTDAMETDVTEDRVVTRIERPTTGGLRSTVDDYVVNLRVAERVAATARGEDATVDEVRADPVSDGTNDSDITTDDTHDT